ncbi:DUF6058 family natural product biosynthesis protein [Kordiimonas aquimaris]|uniref:DUF6058 family natural product biosynthesis protein n=1 Tax=Kordiimonas aquimaris TaxID=707591 RepID=UPI0021D03808|nr:DUF6058 family natural product biosynthesis protein [Kordiimonas aquimaris]
MSSYNYITENFISLEQLSTLSGATTREIESMIAAQCLPDAAYQLKGECTITSIFGDYVEEIRQSFFPNSYVDMVRQILSDPRALEDIARSYKQVFYDGYRGYLIEFDAQNYGFHHLFDASGQVSGAAADAFFDSEWEHYRNGVYGLCTNSASIEEIATKEAMIARIKFLMSKESPLSAPDTEMLKKAVDMLDKASAQFAPHEREASSRGKYIDAVNRQYFDGEAC